MTTRTEALYEKVTEVVDSLEDGFQLSDIALMLKTAVECAEVFSDHSGPGKRELAIQFCKEVLRQTDGPGPDMLVDPIIEIVIPPLIDLLVDATRGLLEVNNEDG